MTLGKATMLTAGFLGAFALGMGVDRAMVDRTPAATPAPVVDTASAEAPRPAAPAPPTRVRLERKADADRQARMVSMSTKAPELHERLKPVLNRGTKMDLAANGFRDAEQFATVAHAARNTAIPFVVLKHRVLDEGQTLTEAIRAAKPEADAKAEAARARDAARADLAAIES